MERLKILVIHDMAALAGDLASALSVLDCEVRIAVGPGEEAVEAVASLRPDLVIIDTDLPGGSASIDTVVKIRAEHDLPVLCLTPHGDQERVQQGEGTQPCTFLLKPIAEQELVNAIEGAIRRHVMNREFGESAERFRAFYDRAPLPYQLLDRDGRLIAVNATWLETLGYTREEVIGRPFSELVLAHHQDRFEEITQHAGDVSLLPGVEVELLRKDRSHVPVLIDVHVSPGPDGQISHAHCILHDMTERNRAEATLRARNRALALLSRAAHVINSTLDLDSVLASVLTETRRLLDVTACSVWLLDPDSGELVCRQATDPGGDILRGWRLAPGEGLGGWTVQTGQSLIVADAKLDERHYSGVDSKTGLSSRSILCVPLLAGGEVIGVLQVVDQGANRFDPSDLTLIESLAALAVTAIQNARLFGQSQREIAERREAEAAIKQHAARLALLNQISDKITATLDLNTVLGRSARLVQQTFGYQHVAVYTVDHERLELRMRAAEGDFAQLIPSDHRLKLGQGMVGWVGRHNETLLANDVGEEPRFLNYFVDLLPTRSELCVPIRAGAEMVGVVDVQSSILNAFDESDVMVMETLAGQIGVAVENIRLSADAAEVEILRELDNLRAELIANVSHELRTPLGLIKVFCTTLLRDDVELDPETQHEFLLDINDETTKLEQIVDNLLDLSRIGAGRLRLHKEPADLGQLANRVMDSMRAHLQGHHFVHDFPAESIVARVDSERIEQVLRNLLSNAIKYSPDGGQISVHGRWDGKQMIVIWVSDQGICIPAEDLSRIFERFYRVRNEATERVRGAGLGLAVSKSLVEAHGGHIWAESTPGVGSTFYFTLPVEDKPDTLE